MCVWLYFFFNICFGRKLLDFCKEVCRAMLDVGLDGVYLLI